MPAEFQDWIGFGSWNEGNLWWEYLRFRECIGQRVRGAVVVSRGHFVFEVCTSELRFEVHASELRFEGVL